MCKYDVICKKCVVVGEFGLCKFDGDLFGVFVVFVLMLFVFGYEVVGELVEDCDDLFKGICVVVDLVFVCVVCGVELCVFCCSGCINLCDYVIVGYVLFGL